MTRASGRAVGLVEVSVLGQLCFGRTLVAIVLRRERFLRERSTCCKYFRFDLWFSCHTNHLG